MAGLILDPIFLLLGIFILAKGEVEIAPRRTIRGTRAKLLGVLYVSILPLDILTGAIASGSRGSAVELVGIAIWLAVVGFAVLMTIFLVAFVKGESTRRPVEASPTPEWLEKLGQPPEQDVK
jgi:hypothetical protein